MTFYEVHQTKDVAGPMPRRPYGVTFSALSRRSRFLISDYIKRPGLLGSRGVSFFL